MFGFLGKRKARYSDVLSVALSVYKITHGKDSGGHDCFYIVLSANNLQHLVDVARVLRANGIRGKLCRTPVLNQNNEMQEMLAICVRNKNQEFMHDVENTIDDVTYFRDVVLPRYHATQNKYR